MHSILYKIKSFPRRKHNRQLLANLLNEYPIEKQPTNHYHSLPTIKSPTTTATTTQIEPTKPLLIASEFHQNEDSNSTSTPINIDQEDDVFEYAFEKEIRKPSKRRPTPYASAEEEEYQESKEQEEEEDIKDVNKKEIKQLKKIVKIQKKQLDYLLSRSFENNYYGSHVYTYYNDNDDDYYPKDNYALYSTNYSKKRNDEHQLSSSVPSNLYDSQSNMERSRSLPNFGNREANKHSSRSKKEQEQDPNSVPTMYNRYQQETMNNYNRYPQQDSVSSNSIPSTYKRYSRESTTSTTTIPMPMPYHHQDSTTYTNSNNSYSYKNYSYSYQYPMSYNYQSNSSSSSVPTSTYYYDYPSYYNIT